MLDTGCWMLDAGFADRPTGDPKDRRQDQAGSIDDRRFGFASLVCPGNPGRFPTGKTRRTRRNRRDVPPVIENPRGRGANAASQRDFHLSHPSLFDATSSRNETRCSCTIQLLAFSRRPRPKRQDGPQTYRPLKKPRCSSRSLRVLRVFPVSVFVDALIVEAGDASR